MKNWMKRSLVVMLLVGLVAAVPVTIGCSSKANKNKASKDFNKDGLSDQNPTAVKMQPLTGPGGPPAAPPAAK